MSLSRVISLAALVVIFGGVLTVQSALAEGDDYYDRDADVIVRGGGQGTFRVDLDGDSDIDGSYLNFFVVLRGGGAASGHFLCLMAGEHDFLGLPVMLVEGPVTDGRLNRDKSVTFGGKATVDLGDGKPFTGVPFAVTVTAGGPGIGKLQLTVIGAFDGVPGDTIPRNGNYDLAWETMSTGGITIPTD